VGAMLNTVAFLLLMGIMKGQAGAAIAHNIRTVSPVSVTVCLSLSASCSQTEAPLFLTRAWWGPQQTIPIIVAGYKVWPIASIISFSLIPIERRIVFLSFIGLLWGIYMSIIAARV
jgi:hypothetical protein